MSRNETGKFYKTFMLFLEISLVVTILLCIYWVFKGDKSELTSPFPVFRNATKIDLLQVDGLLSGSCDHFSFGGEKVEAYFTQENEKDIFDFYKQVAKDNHMSERVSDYAVTNKDTAGPHFTSLCFSGIYKGVQTASFGAIFDISIQQGNANRTSDNLPLNNQKTDLANMVALIDTKNHSDIIQRFTKNIPPGAYYFVVLLQGYIYYI